MAPPAWNAGLQTGTRGAPHGARLHPLRNGGPHPGAELKSTDGAPGLEPRPPVGTRAVTPRTDSPAGLVR